MVIDLVVSSSSLPNSSEQHNASKPGRGDFAHRPGLGWKCRASYLALLIVVLSVYSYPSIRTALTTRSLRLPAVTGPDQGLYLTLSRLNKTEDGRFVNPYYHITVPYPISLLKFRLGPFLFGLLDRIFAGRIWFTSFAWNLLWWGLLCTGSICLFNGFLPRSMPELVVAGSALLTLFSVNGLLSVARGFHFSSADLQAGLPYIRPFTPQVAVPLLIWYLALQIRALKGVNPVVWGAMALLQFMAFAAFPYATLIMAGTTAFAAFWFIFASPHRRPWRTVLLYFFICFLSDIGFALHGSAGFKAGFPDKSSPIKLQLFLVGQMIGKLWILTAILVIATAATKKLSPVVKWPLVGLGFSTLIFKLSDAVFSERLFFISDHISYFFQPTVTILLVFLVVAYVPRSSQAFRFTCTGIAVLCVVYGFLMAEGNYRANLPYNLQQADLSRWAASGEVSANDLIVSHWEGEHYGAHYQGCEWMPLFLDAQILYCRNAQVALTPEQNRTVQRFREALYMYFDGKDSQWVEKTTDFEAYGLFGELSSFRRTEELNARIIALRQELSPIFDRIEHQDPSVRSFFQQFPRVWIIENREFQLFNDRRLASYLDLQEPEAWGSVIVQPAHPREKDQSGRPITNGFRR